MRFQLRHLILWPRNERLEPRIVSFEPDRLNVITGASKTGKSAVIPIMDYCLASERCAIPVNTIRVACGWFGIVVDTDNGQLLLARREPGDQQSTGDMYMSEGPSVQIPRSAPSKNATVDSVKRRLDRLAGLSNLGFDPTGISGGYTGRPSFRDMLAFVFQPQNIVANADVLFYRADTTEHREKLRTIFPYVLGAVSPEVLAKRWEIDQINRELRRKERELRSIQDTSAAWNGRLLSWLAEARDLGLVDSEAAGEAISRQTVLPVLREVSLRTSDDSLLTDGSIQASAGELSQLENEESAIAADLVHLKTRLDNMKHLRGAVDDYTGALEKQRDRLHLSRWLREGAEMHGGDCPFCGSRQDLVADELDVLCEALANIEGDARQMAPVPATFDREFADVGESLRRGTDQFRAIQLRRQAAVSRSSRLQTERWRAASIDRFLGRLQQVLELLEAPTTDHDLESEVAELTSRLARLRHEVSEGAIKARQQAALDRISASMARILPQLDAERPLDRADLNVSDLTVGVTGLGGRQDALWEIGSGANWLAYHVAVTLALHGFFTHRPGNPVPSMLVMDQPSQVYFPHKLAGRQSEDMDPQLADEDVVAVRRVFEVLSSTSRQENLQTVVLDHAGADVWGSVDGAYVVEEWREGKALVPLEWL
jgi:hypothetical protein